MGPRFLTYSFEIRSVLYELVTRYPNLFSSFLVYALYGVGYVCLFRRF
jgi:hypothetical protein